MGFTGGEITNPTVFWGAAMSLHLDQLIKAKNLNLELQPLRLPDVVVLVIC